VIRLRSPTEDWRRWIVNALEFRHGRGTDELSFNWMCAVAGSQSPLRVNGLRSGEMVVLPMADESCFSRQPIVS
jgi:hypothetical protein